MYSGLVFVKEIMTQYNRSNKNRKSYHGSILPVCKGMKISWSH